MDEAAQHAASETPFHQVPVEITVSVGKAFPKVKDLLSLAPQAVLSLDKSVDDPVDLYVGQKLIARGILEEAEGSDSGKLVVRLTEVAKPDSSL